MSAAEFRAAFQRETDRYLARLGDDKRQGSARRRRREDGAARSDTEDPTEVPAVPAIVVDGVKKSVPDSAVAQLRSLASSLAEGAVLRAGELAASRECGAGSPGPACEAAGGADAREATSELEAECRRLEEELLQRREAQARRRGELLAKLAAAHACAAGRLESAALGACEAPAAQAPAELGLEGPEGHEERLGSVRAQLQAASALAGGLCARRAGIEKVEAWQSRAPCAAEAALANAPSADVLMQEDLPFQDTELLDRIRKGDKVRRRLQAPFAGA